jgi:hypothetical protein
MTELERYKALVQDQFTAEGEWQARIENQRHKFPFTPSWFEARRLRREAYQRFLAAHELVEESLARRFKGVDQPYPFG